MKMPRLSVFLAFVLFSLAGCESTSNLPTDWVPFEGTVVWVPESRGFWALRSTEYGRINPLGVPEAFQRDGLKVTGEVRFKPDVQSARNWGTVAEVRNLQAQP